MSVVMLSQSPVSGEPAACSLVDCFRLATSHGWVPFLIVTGVLVAYVVGVGMFALWAGKRWGSGEEHAPRSRDGPAADPPGLDSLNLKDLLVAGAIAVVAGTVLYVALVAVLGPP